MGNATENNHNFKMPCIYLPSHATDDPHAAPNKIGDLCDEIVRCANMKAQSNMSRLKNDSDSLLSWIETVKKMDVEKKAAKGCRVQISRTLWVLVLSMVCLSFLCSLFYKTIPLLLYIYSFGLLFTHSPLCAIVPSGLVDVP